MKIKIFLLVVAVTFSIKCSEDPGFTESSIDNEGPKVTEEILSPEVIVPQNTLQITKVKSKWVTKKIKIKGQGTIDRVPSLGLCTPEELLSVVNGKGSATHLGKFTLYLTYCSEQDYYCDSTTPPIGYHVFANGDTLYTEFVLAGYDDEGRFYQDYIYTGGTGKYEGASGQATLYFTFDKEPCPTVYENYGQGELSYYLN